MCIFQDMVLQIVMVTFCYFSPNLRLGHYKIQDSFINYRFPASWGETFAGINFRVLAFSCLLSLVCQYCKI